MKYFSFKIVILCILLPPVVYIFSVQSLETHLKNRYTNEIEVLVIGTKNTQAKDLEFLEKI